MDLIYVQFSDETETVMISWFCCQPDPEYYDNLGEIYADDPRYIVYFEALPDMIKPLLPQPIYP